MVDQLNIEIRPPMDNGWGSVSVRVSTGYGPGRSYCAGVISLSADPDDLL
jgi:hypothetical protein